MRRRSVQSVASPQDSCRESRDGDSLINQACQSLATVLRKVGGEESLEVSWPLQHLGVTQGASRVVISRAPMLFHTRSREFVILGMPFVIPGVVDQMDDVEDLAISGRTEELVASGLFLRSAGSFSRRAAATRRSSWMRLN